MYVKQGYHNVRAPLGTNQAPLGTHQAPLGTHRAPLGTHRAPLGPHLTPAGNRDILVCVAVVVAPTSPMVSVITGIIVMGVRLLIKL